MGSVSFNRYRTGDVAMKYKLNERGEITCRITPAHGTEDLYDGFEDGDIPEGATHFRAGEFLSKPPQPSPTHTWDDEAFCWVDSLDLVAAAARQRRDALLSASDWTQLPDVPLESKAAWATYRQALRDVTEQPGFPTEIMWPALVE